MREEMKESHPTKSRHPSKIIAWSVKNAQIPRKFPHLPRKRTAIYDKELGTGYPPCLSKTTVFSLSGVHNIDDRRRIVRWMARCTFGNPPMCNNCNEKRVMERHAQDCCRGNVDVLLRNRRWAQALEAIGRIIDKCTNWRKRTIEGPPSSMPRLRTCEVLAVI